MEKESKNVGLEKEDVMNQVRWRVGVGEIAVSQFNPILIRLLLWWGKSGHPRLRV